MKVLAKQTEFKPFTIEIVVETKEELNALRNMSLKGMFEDHRIGEADTVIGTLQLIKDACAYGLL